MNSPTNFLGKLLSKLNGQVAFLGPEATFTHAATLKAFGESSELVPEPSILAVFESVTRNERSLGVVPIENSTEGSVNLTLDALYNHPALRIVGEVVLQIEQCLIGEGPLDNSVVEVVSHPHALPQCRSWLSRHIPQARWRTVSSTAAAAEQVKGDPSRVAVASALAASRFDLRLLKRGIQDTKDNATRFVVLGREGIAPTGHDKTSVVFSAKHEQGALLRILSVLDEHGINLSRIESRPLPNTLWEYLFYVDLLGHSEESGVRSALNAITDAGNRVRVFGSYPTTTR